MTSQRFHVDKHNPCLACGGIRFFRRSRKCISCTKRFNALKAAKTMEGREHDWNTQYKEQDILSGAFKAKEAKIMQGVNYAR